jgi:acetyl esterase/lipase
VTDVARAIRRQLRDLGRRFTPEVIQGTHQLYVAPHRERGYLAPSVERDLAYGTDPRHRLDVHHAGLGAVERPVLLFVHGGGFTSGDKRVGDLPFQDHLGGWAVRHGMIGVTMNYRLAPQHRWPSGAEDVGAAVEWLATEIGGYGGDAGRIVVAGHSAGASHVAGFLAGQARTAPRYIRAAILLSGVYDVAAGSSSQPILQSYFGTEESKYPEMSTIPGLLASTVPTLVGVAELDGSPFHQQAWLLTSLLFDRDGLIPPLVWAPGHNHVSYVLGLGVDDDSALDVAIRRFVAGLFDT